MKIQSYSIEVNNQLSKRPAMWVTEKCRTCPVVYFQKAKWLSEESFLLIVEAILLNLPKGTVLKRAIKKSRKD